MLSISPSRIREIHDPMTRILNQLHKILFISQLPPSMEGELSYERALIERYKRELFSHRNHYRGRSLKDELHKLMNGSQEMIDLSFRAPAADISDVHTNNGLPFGQRQPRLSYEDLQKHIEQVLEVTGYYALHEMACDAPAPEAPVIERTNSMPDRLSSNKPKTLPPVRTTPRVGPSGRPRPCEFCPQQSARNGVRQVLGHLLRTRAMATTQLLLALCLSFAAAEEAIDWKMGPPHGSNTLCTLPDSVPTSTSPPNLHSWLYSRSEAVLRSPDAAAAYKKAPNDYWLGPHELPEEGMDGMRGLPDVRGQILYCLPGEKINVSMQTPRVMQRHGQAVYFCCHGCWSGFWRNATAYIA